MKKKVIFDYWIIKLRNEEAFMAEKYNEFNGFRSIKFSSKAGAIAFCRKYDYNPIDYVLVKARFTNPTILETAEIDYSDSRIAVATKDID